MQNDLIDRIYEAALVPDLWPEIAADLARHVGGRESCLVLNRSDDGDWAATPRCSDTIAAQKEERGGEHLFNANLLGQHLRARRFDQLNHRGFLAEHQLMSTEEIAVDHYQLSIRQNGLEFQAFSRIRLPNDAVLTISVERGGNSRAFGRLELAFLDDLYPHLVRAALVTTHLGTEKARASVLSMEGMGFPAAMLDRRGTVITTNALFERPETPATTGAFGRVGLPDAAANLKLAEALEAIRNGRRPPQQSIAIPESDTRPAAIIHLLPVRRCALDVFCDADVLLVVSWVDIEARIPSPHLLSTLFDLSPAEARLAAKLAGGASLQRAAAACGITLNSARTYLIRIFRKTGTSQQSQLVALLKTVQPFPSAF